MLKKLANNQIESNIDKDKTVQYTKLSKNEIRKKKLLLG